MDWKRAKREALWINGGGAGAGAVTLASFCVALRSDRRSNLVEVPDWIGRGREEALAQARSLGLVIEVAEMRHDPGLAADRIVRQEPAAGTQVRHGRTIRVVVSL